MYGVLKNINKEKGFGFILIEGREKDLFFHVSAFQGDFESLNAGEKVFVEEIVSTTKGEAGSGVRLA